MIYFTADIHFYHENIINHTKRPFKNADEMNKKIKIREKLLQIKTATAFTFKYYNLYRFVVLPLILHQ